MGLGESRWGQREEEDLTSGSKGIGGGGGRDRAMGLMLCSGAQRDGGGRTPAWLFLPQIWDKAFVAL